MHASSVLPIHVQLNVTILNKTQPVKLRTRQIYRNDWYIKTQDHKKQTHDDRKLIFTHRISHSIRNGGRYPVVVWVSVILPH